MKKIFRQLIVFMLVIFSIGTIAGVTNIHAKNEKIDLSEKYTGKKLDRIKGAIKGKKDYRFLISSSDSLDSIKAFFVAGDEKARVKQYGDDKYMIRLPLNSQFLSEELSLIDQGILPTIIGNYNLIEPEIVEGFAVDYVLGEETDKLWDLSFIGADIFQEELATKEKIKVAVLDTGIDYTHTDLDNNYNFILSYDFVNEDTDAIDDNGHGTQVAGIIGAEVNGTGRYGVNSNTDLIGLKVLDASGIGSTYDILEAIEYAKLNNIKVLNMSFGGTGDATTSVVCQAISDAKLNGIFTIASAGNNNSEITNLIPASCPDSITVGSTDNLNEKAAFSNYGTGVTLYAPGVGIYSTSLFNGYSTINGTSFSAGFVSGLVAKEFAFSGGISYDNLVSNVSNNYILINNFSIKSDSEELISSSGSIIIDEEIGFLPIESTDTFSIDSVSNILTDNLVGYWSFNQCTAKDETNNSIDGLFYRSPTCVEGYEGKALKFGGPYDRDYIIVKNNTNISLYNNFSYNIRFKIDGNTSMDGRGRTTEYGIQTLLSKAGDRTGLTIRMGRSLNDNLWYPYVFNGRCCSTSGRSVITKPGNGLKVGEWHMLTFTNGDGFARMYLDGELQNELLSSYFNLNYYTISQDLQFGVGQSRTWYPFNGTLDEIRLYNKSLSQNEILNLFGVSNNPFLPGETIIDYLTRINGGNVKNPISDNKVTGDPVNLHTGEFIYDNVVMQHNSKGFPFEFAVNYKNQITFDGIVGNNFDHNYNQYLEEQSDGNVYYYNGKLGVFEFVKNYTGFDYNKTINAELILIDGKYNLVFNNSKTLVFNTDLKLESISDNFSNTFNFVYDTENLIQIIDSNLREYNLSYNIDGKLQYLTDFNGDKIEFVYYGVSDLDGNENDLKTIKMINGLSEKEINFTYSVSETPELAHNIIKLIDSDNNIYVENTYDTEDRVSSQMFGTESINYTYTTDSDGKITENSVIDREGNNVIYAYDANGNTTQKIVVKATGNSVYSYEYNSDNYISKEILPLGNGYTYKYDVNHNLIEKRQKTDANALDSTNDIITSYTYNLDFNKPTQIVSPNGTIINFDLDINGNVIRKEILGVTDIDGLNQNIVETYEYNISGELIKKIDANLNEANFEYSSGSLVKSYRPHPNPLLIGEGIATEYSYDSKGNMTSITDGEGNITNLTYDDFNLLNNLTTPEGIVSEYTYNKLNKKVNESIILGDLSKVSSSYEYDILDNPTQITSDIDSTRQKITVTKYDKNSNITEITDGNNATVQFSYNEEGYITSKTIINGTTNIVTSYIYDENNRLTKQINPNLSEITFEYDLFDRIIKQSLSNGVYTVLSYDKIGNILEASTYNSINELLQKESSVYDKLGRKIQKTIPILNSFPSVEGQEATSVTYYDAVGNIVKIVDANLGEINYGYDNFNRLSQVIDKLGNIVTNTYNKNDKLISRTITATDLTTITTTYSYDSDNRLISETNNLNQTTSYTYNNLNQVTSKTDKDGTITTYKYDYVGNVLEETTGTKTTAYEYDINSNLVKLTDANNNVTLYEYDSLNRLVKQTYPDGNILTQQYDISGNLITRTDLNGTIITNNYDELNRLISRDILTGTGVLGATSETYTYDELGRVISGTDNLGNDVLFNYDSLNRLISETNSNELVNYTYDINNNITSINNTNYAYDISNRLQSVKNGTENIADYTYNSLTQLSQTLGNGVTTNYSYDELLRIASLGNYNYTYNTGGNITSDGIDYYSYDELGQITGVNYDQVNIPEYNGDKIERFFYDNVGNRTSQENYTLKDITTETCTDEVVVEDIVLPNGKTKTVERKVTTCETAITQVEKEKNTLTYDSNTLNQYTKLQNLNKNDEIKKEFTYTYDNNGNLSKDDINQYFYDYKNRLVKVIQNEVYKVDELGNIIEIIPEIEIVNYEYDILGRRITKTTQEKTTQFIYAGQQAIQENTYSFSGTELILQETRENIYSNNLDDILSTIVTDYTTETPTTNQYYYEKNHLGSITKITDTLGAIIEQYEYDVFGVAYANVNNVEAITNAPGHSRLSIKKAKGSETNNAENSEEIIIDNIRYKRYNGIGRIGNTRLYTGREYDAELKLYYNRARYYSPDLGRFISRDPIDITDDVNLYGYVGNNGVMYVDRMGLSKTLIIGFKGGDNEPGYYDDEALANPIYHSSGIISLLNKINQDNNPNTEVLALTSASLVYNSKTIEAAEDYIIKNKDNYDKIIIVGHSLGGDHGVVLSNKLNEHDITVDLLVTVDIKSYYENDTIDSNVIEAINYYQTNDFLLHGEDIELGFNNNVSKVSNILVNDFDGNVVHHTDIDNYLVDIIYNLIK